MKRPNEDIISQAASGDGAALAKNHKYLQGYSAALSAIKKGHLDIEKSSIILKGMDYLISEDKMEAWAMLLDEMVRQIKSAEITNLN